jgi:hypothetical protein
MVMPRVRKQLYRYRACGRQSRENPTPHAYPEARRQEILHASSRTQQSALSHPHVWRLAHYGVHLDQKKVAQLPPLQTTLLTPNPEDPTSTILELDERMARLCSKKRTTAGFGLPSAARRDRWSLLRWVIGANGHASGCGKRFRRGISGGTAKRLSGRPKRR